MDADIFNHKEHKEIEITEKINRRPRSDGIPVGRRRDTEKRKIIK